MATLQKIKMFGLNQLPPIGIKLHLSVPRNSIFQAVNIEDEDKTTKAVYLYYEVPDSILEYSASEIQEEIFVRLGVGLPIPAGANLIFLEDVMQQHDEINYSHSTLLILYKIL